MKLGFTYFYVLITQFGKSAFQSLKNHGALSLAASELIQAGKQYYPSLHNPTPPRWREDVIQMLWSTRDYLHIPPLHLPHMERSTSSIIMES
jgi:hypothetical protein